MSQEIETFYPKNRQEWREWLQENHQSKQSIWVIYYKKISKRPRVEYGDAVDEALCFGWIDSTAKTLDEHRYMQYFCKRKPKSVWSKVNKAKIERLIADGLMTQAGYDSIETAKTNGSWSILDEVEELVIPPDLEDVFLKTPAAKENFLAFSRTDKRNILQWLVLAKSLETRQKRIAEIVTLAANKQKPKQFTASKK